MQQSPQPPLCVPLIEALLNLGCRLAPLPSFLWIGIYWINGYLQILPTVIFLCSISSLHICSLSYMVIVLIPYTSPPYGTAIHPVGKSYASIVDDEKSAFEQRSKHRQNGHKKSRYLHCSCFCRYGRVAVIYEEILIFVWRGSIINSTNLNLLNRRRELLCLKTNRINKY